MKSKKHPEVTMIDGKRELANYTFKAKYARYKPELGRRENWDEAVGRVEQMHLSHFTWLDDDTRQEVRWAFDQVRDKLVVPSMRSMQFGGPAVLAHNARIYNCAVRHIDSPRAFAEVMYLLLCGTGVGIGLHKGFTSRLPDLVNHTNKTGTVLAYVVEDNIEGWADSIEALINCYFKNNAWSGRKIVFDYSKIRAKGTELKTGGGKAPGHEPLKRTHQEIKYLLDYAIEVKKQRRLRGIDIYDILMHCADAVISGGVRRAATNTIFDYEDKEMMRAKELVTIEEFRVYDKFEKHNRVTGKTEDWYRVVLTYKGRQKEVQLNEFDREQLAKTKQVGWMYVEPQRGRSNNSCLLLRKEATFEQFIEIINISKMWGEPGFVFADDPRTMFNPCFEIGFIPVTDDGVCGVQFCNLTSMNGARIKDRETFHRAIKAATIIGTLQAGYTNFPYLSNTARELTEGEALLGVSITGVMDSPNFLLDKDNLLLGSNYAKEVNEEWASKLGIKPAARVTCIKPEGTTTLVLGADGSGANPAHAKPKFIRRVQANKIENVYRFFKDHNPHAAEESVWNPNGTDDVISFPVETPDYILTKDDLTALQHLEHIKTLQKFWVKPGSAEHNEKKVQHSVSCTVVVGDNEWDSVTKYLFKNRNFFSAVALIGKSGDKDYPQAPNEKMITEDDLEHFKALQENWQVVDYDALVEADDETELQGTIACGGGACEIL